MLHLQFLNPVGNLLWSQIFPSEDQREAKPFQGGDDAALEWTDKRNQASLFLSICYRLVDCVRMDRARQFGATA